MTITTDIMINDSRASLTSSSIKNLVSLSTPIYISKFCQNILFLIGTLFAGHLSIKMIAGIGMGIAIFKMISYFSNGMSSTTTQNIGNLIGNNKLDEIKSVMQQSLYLAICSGILTAAFCFLCAHYVYLLPLDKDVAFITQQYLEYSSLGLLFSSILTVLVSYAESKNEAKVIAIISFFSVGIGALLIYTLTLKFNLGGIGFGLTNTITFLLNLLLVFSFLRFKEKKNLVEHHSFLQDFEPLDMGKIAKLSKIGVPVGVLLAADGALTSVSSIIMSSLDKRLLAVHQSLTITISQIYLVETSLVVGISILVAKTFGGKEYKDILYWMKIGITTLAIFLLLNFCMVAYFSNGIFSAFLKDKHLLHTAISILPFAFVACFLDVGQVFSTALLKAIKGVTMSIMVVNLLFVGLGISLTYYFLHFKDGGMLSYWYAIGIGYFLILSFNMVAFRKRIIRLNSFK